MKSIKNCFLINRSNVTNVYFSGMAKLQLIKEQEAMAKLNISNARQLRRLVNSGKLQIRITQATRKTEPLYYAEDIETVLRQNTKTPPAKEISNIC